MKQSRTETTGHVERKGIATRCALAMTHKISFLGAGTARDIIRTRFHSNDTLGGGNNPKAKLYSLSVE